MLREDLIVNDGEDVTLDPRIHYGRVIVRKGGTVRVKAWVRVEEMYREPGSHFDGFQALEITTQPPR